jgi:exodeoxyribonuclease VII large subunit
LRRGVGHNNNMDLIDDDITPTGNQPEYTVSELSGAVKRVIEGEFGLVRVRGRAKQS